MRKRPYFKMESAMTAILRDASGKMHHGILFDRRLRIMYPKYPVWIIWINNQLLDFSKETNYPFLD